MGKKNSHERHASRRGETSYRVEQKTKDRIVAAYRWGVGLDGLRERFGVDSTTIRKILAGAGCAPPKAKNGIRYFFGPP